MPSPRELAGEEGVLRHEARQVREAVEARVCPGVEDEHRRRLHQEETHPAQQPVPEHIVRLLRQHGRRAAVKRHGVRDVGEE